MKSRINDYLSSRSCLSGIPLLLVSCMVHVGALQAQTLRIGAFDETRHGSASLASTRLADELRASLSRHIEALGFDDYEFVSVSHLTSDLSALADVILLHPASSMTSPMHGDLSVDEQEALGDFVQEGGGVLIAADGAPGNDLSASNALLAPFGVRLTTTRTTTRFGTVDAAHPVTDGPFGEVRSPRFGNRVTERGSLASWFTELGPFASALVTAEPDHEPLLAVIERSALGPGSGRVVLTSEANWLADSAVNGGYFREHEPLFLNIMTWITEDVPFPVFRRGDCNSDGGVDLSDAVCILNWLFTGSEVPGCVAAANVNGDDSSDLTDAVSLLNYLFQRGTAPPEPFSQCGPGSLEADRKLGCDTPASNCR